MSWPSKAPRRFGWSLLPAGEIQSVVQIALNEIPDVFRSAVILRDLEGLSGNVLYYHGDYGAALKEYNKVLDVDPNYWLAYGSLALTLRTREDVPACLHGVAESDGHIST